MMNDQISNDTSGQELDSNPAIQPSASEPERGQAMTGLVLGVIAMVAWLIPIIGLPTAVIGLVFNILGLRSNKKRALWGITLCTIALLLTVVNGIAGALLMH